MIGRVLRALERRVRCQWALLRARSSSWRRLRAGGMQRVLVLCYGNIYRSPFVGEYLKQRVDKSIEVRSAGFHSTGGRPASPEHHAMSLRHGVSLASHRSTVVDAELLAWADTIVFMDRRNWLALHAAGADPRRLVWLGALDGGATEIADPYEMTAAQAEVIVTRLGNTAKQLTEILNAQTRTALSGRN